MFEARISSALKTNPDEIKLYISKHDENGKVLFWRQDRSVFKYLTEKISLQEVKITDEKKGKITNKITDNFDKIVSSLGQKCCIKTVDGCNNVDFIISDCIDKQLNLILIDTTVLRKTE